MGATSAPKDPVIFLKPTTRCVYRSGVYTHVCVYYVDWQSEVLMRVCGASSYVANGGAVLLPPGIGDVHHEVELGVRTTHRNSERSSVSQALSVIVCVRGRS